VRLLRRPRARRLTDAGDALYRTPDCPRRVEQAGRAVGTRRRHPRDVADRDASMMAKLMRWSRFCKRYPRFRSTSTLVAACDLLRGGMTWPYAPAPNWSQGSCADRARTSVSPSLPRLPRGHAPGKERICALTVLLGFMPERLPQTHCRNGGGKSPRRRFVSRHYAVVDPGARARYSALPALLCRRC